MSDHFCFIHTTRILLLGLLALILTACASQPSSTTRAATTPVSVSPLPDDIGVLVIAPDRGFVGNQTVRRAYRQFAPQASAAQLLFVTDERSKTIFNQRLAALQASGADAIIVLPLVTSSADSRWQLAQQWLRQLPQLHLAPIYGQSYLAVEDLSQRLHESGSSAKKLLLVGYGASSELAAKKMQADLQHMATFASSLPASAITTAVYPSRHATDYDALHARAKQTLQHAHNTLVVPVAMAPRASTMMSFERWYKRLLPADSHTLPATIATPAHLTQWLRLSSQTASLAIRPASDKETGIVALVHGADWFWNQAIREALLPVARQYPLEYAFSMADPVTVRHAIERLEKRGVRRILIVRTYSMASSFLPSVNRMTGLDVAAQKPQPSHMMMHHSHRHSLAAKARLRASVPLTTTGGVEDHPLFAQALLANARAVSSHPANEVVIVVAHGHGSDRDNQHWLTQLRSLTEQMRHLGGDDFATIDYGTWREDWPDKHEKSVKKIRKLVEKAQQNGKRVLIVPARINAQGDADQYLRGVDFGWAQGFAQTEYFAQWFEQTVRQAAF